MNFWSIVISLGALVLAFISLAATVIQLKEYIPYIKNIVSKRQMKADERWQQDMLKFANPQNVAKFVHMYYVDSSIDGNSGLQRLIVRVDGKVVDTIIFSRPNWLNINKSLVEIAMYLNPDPPPILQPLCHSAKYERKFVARAARTGIRTWNALSYRLWEVNGVPNPELHFTQTKFFDYLYRDGLLAEETCDALIAERGDVSRVIEQRKTLLPLRAEIIPNLLSLVNLKSRICIGGPEVLFACARNAEDDFVFLLQVRSGKVVDGRGLYTVLPQAFHQPMGADVNREVNILCTVYREIYEEVFGGEEVSTADGHLAHDWYFEKCPALKYFRDHMDTVVVELLGMGLNGQLGSGELSVLFAVTDPNYWDQYRGSMRMDWESSNVLQVSTKNRDLIRELMCQKDWASEGLFCFAQALLRLKEIAPSRVNLPDIVLERASDSEKSRKS